MLQMRKLRLSQDRLTQGHTAGSGANLSLDMRDDAFNPGQVLDMSASGTHPQSHTTSPQPTSAQAEVDLLTGCSHLHLSSLRCPGTSTPH